MGSKGRSYTFDAEEILIHQDYDPFDLTNDLALVRISGIFPPTTKPVTLQKTSLSLKAGDSILLAGFGRDKEIGTGEYTDVRLRAVSVRPVEDEDPSATYRLHVFDQFDGKGACKGDSGGPAFFEESGVFHQIGVTSLGLYRHTDGKKDLCLDVIGYSSVSVYWPWIKASYQNLKTKNSLFGLR